ncbi:hypothetical protein L6452_21795 [Arctium lappa]|uniref:Uncharacterized protein n=1 Tax=Arctium lappa TaxID=4217 RepID=A0ACB9B2D5_ARCLA|nr:hypothetical protein L6452_21795 [Arctium lappa]
MPRRVYNDNVCHAWNRACPLPTIDGNSYSEPLGCDSRGETVEVSPNVDGEGDKGACKENTVEEVCQSREKPTFHLTWSESVKILME